MATNGNPNHSDQFITSSETNSSAGAAPTADQSGGSTANNNLSKDEVAWFFVEQYYTTLSRSPEKLHLFYGKRSQFVYGQEAEVTGVSVGRQAIQQRIKALDFSDSCKVRISNVDSMNTDDSILIQVIGETSKKAGEDPKKFVQTFVLAQQPSGYFVLNDIIRYIDDEEGEEEAQETDQNAPVELPATATTNATTVPAEYHQEPETSTKPESVAEEEQVATSHFDQSVVDEKLEEISSASKDTTSEADSAVETPAEPAAAVEETAEPVATQPRPDLETAIQELAKEDAEEPEKPVDPSSSPVSRPTPSTAAPAAAPAPAPAQPPKPKTWATLAAAAAGARPAPALPKTVPTPVAAPQPRPATQAVASSQPAASSQPTEASTASVSAKESAEWQTAGSDSKRHNRTQSIPAPQLEKEGALGYVKYVTDKVQSEDLKQALAKHGELVYFDINRQKNCAFVEYSSPAGYQAAVAANPHTVNGESITVEPRRPKANAYGGAGYSTGGRGNMPNRGGRGGFDGGRPANQGGRGSFGGQNRGGRGGMPRGRGGAQAAANA